MFFSNHYIILNVISIMGKNLFNPSVILPPEMVISSAGSHLYKIGLSLYRMGSKSRPKLNNPLFIFIVHSLVFLRHCVSMRLSEDNRYAFELLSDWSYFLNSREVIALTVFLYVLWSNTSQILHYWYFKRNIKPSYLKPFEMMSGLVSPQSIGLYNEKDIRIMMKRFKLLIKLSEINVTPMAFCALLLAAIPIISNCSLGHILFPGIPWFIFFMLYVYHIADFLLIQMTYFYIICYYLRLKLRNINNEIEINIRRNIKHSEFHALVKYFMRYLNILYLEIKEYNDNYWSTFLFLFIFLLSTCINALLYKSIYGISNTYLVLAIRYYAIICTFLILVLFFIASSVCKEANRSYKLLNKLYVSNMGLKFANSTRFKAMKKNYLNSTNIYSVQNFF